MEWRLLDACNSEVDDVKRVKHALNDGANVNHQDSRGWTALMGACRRVHSQCVGLLINSKADVNAQDEDGRNALMTACENGHSACVELLIKNKADVNARKQDGRTALMFACYNGHAQCVELLVKSKADVRALDQDGWNALMNACHNNHPKCLELLLQTGLSQDDLNVVSNYGDTAVGNACSEGSAPCLQLLLDAKADPYMGEFTASDALLHYAYDHDDDDDDDDEPSATLSERSLTGFVLMCGGYDLKRAQESTGHLHEDYQQIHALLEEHYERLMEVLSESVVVDKRVGRGENGIYHEPLERVLEYSGMLLIPVVLNESEDGTRRRVLLTGSLEATKMAFDRHRVRMCSVCRATTTEPVMICVCQAARYCSMKCAKIDWTRHEEEHVRIMTDG